MNPTFPVIYLSRLHVTVYCKNFLTLSGQGGGGEGDDESSPSLAEKMS